MTKSKIELKEKIAAVDLKAKTLFDEMDEQNRKDLIKELWILNRYISNAETRDREIVEHYVLAVNAFYNKNYAVLTKHPKLQWMLLCLCSFDANRTFFHKWIGSKGREKSNRIKMKILETVYPERKPADLELMAELNSDEDVKDLARQIGWDEKELKNF